MIDMERCLDCGKFYDRDGMFVTVRAIEPSKGQTRFFKDGFMCDQCHQNEAKATAPMAYHGGQCRCAEIARHQQELYRGGT